MQTLKPDSKKLGLSKQPSLPSFISSSFNPKIASTDGSKSTPMKLASLQSLKTKAQKEKSPNIENRKEMLPPWQDDREKQKEDQPVYVTESNDYDKLIQELCVSHAMTAASRFETLCFVEADELNKVK